MAATEICFSQTVSGSPASLGLPFLCNCLALGVGWVIICLKLLLQVFCCTKRGSRYGDPRPKLKLFAQSRNKIINYPKGCKCSVLRLLLVLADKASSPPCATTLAPVTPILVSKQTTKPFTDAAVPVVSWLPGWPDNTVDDDKVEIEF